MDALSIEGVSKSFGKVRAVDDLTAGVPAGSIYGFLGPNGAGKTTLIRMLMNIIYADSGRIEILGEESSKADVKNSIGYMPEERGLYGKMRVGKVLSYIAAIKGMSRTDRTRAVREWLERVELTDWAHKKVEELSKGMQQKLQFVATVINDPEILILDEPFSGLDPVNLDVLKDIILAKRDTGRTIVLSTHMMDQAERLCDFILLINSGKKVIDGTLDQIRGRYESSTVVIEAEGDTSFVSDLPMVERTNPAGRKLEVSLREGADSQELLRALVERVRLRAFEVKVPSLHEIFVHLVGRSNAQDT